MEGLLGAFHCMEYLEKNLSVHRNGINHLSLEMDLDLKWSLKVKLGACMIILVLIMKMKLLVPFDQ